LLPTSKTSDNEDATTTLGNSEAASVKHSVGDAIPEFDHAPENGSKVPSSVRRQDAGDVLPNQPPGPQAVSQPKIFEGQVATVVVQSAAETRDAERLTRCSSDQKVDWLVLAGLDRSEVAMKRGLRLVVGKDGAGEGLDLGDEGSAPAERLPCDRGGLNA
jgi:hypothetical protein